MFGFGQNCNAVVDVLWDLVDGTEMETTAGDLVDLVVAERRGVLAGLLLVRVDLLEQQTVGIERFDLFDLLSNRSAARSGSSPGNRLLAFAAAQTMPDVVGHDFQGR